MTATVGPPPSGEGCLECTAEQGWWFHLRRCVDCGHVGCCDSSPSQHASAHASSSGHAVIASFEPDEDWFYSYRTDDYADEVPLTPPLGHPAAQTVPGPADRVPADWESKLH